MALVFSGSGRGITANTGRRRLKVRSAPPPNSRLVSPYTPFTEFAIDLARRGGAHLMSLLSSAASVKEIRFKGPTDLVTRADKEVEAPLAARGRAASSDHGFLAEEGTGREGAGYRWGVDPLDGTANFPHRLPWLAAS